MRIKTAIAGVGVALAGAAAAATIGAATASAAIPGSDPAQGMYFGVEFDAAETAALADSVIPGLLTQLVPADRTAYVLDSESQLPVVDGYLYATTGAVLKEAAANGGFVGIALVDPARVRGAQLMIVQVLP
ncbi:hypothetical protein [Nocardia huaxiensis]|uniref:hypothetical protein n=1 Tax=Nocardia huaxiensis TaxID=2755382 RepID=UPI001E3B5394|nr:hypothetical protein [Nocardia huaxiensis]UFS95339.1 hypothetical protein LPY97_32410 [Nocardia huaxiensis]